MPDPILRDDAFERLLFDHAVMLTRQSAERATHGVLTPHERASHDAAFRTIDEQAALIHELRVERVCLLAQLETARNELRAAGRHLIADGLDEVIGKAYGRQA